MTVSAEDILVTHNCNNSETEFDFEFKVFQTADIDVILTLISTGTETVLEETTHYAVTGALSTGGKVTTVITYSSLYKITIKLNVALAQETDLIYGGNYSSGNVETMSDKLTKITQQLNEKVVQDAIPDTTLSGTEKVFEIKDNLGVSYYFKASPTKV